jgi:hypothetical protein
VDEGDPTAVVRALTALGGVATRSALTGATSRLAVDRALALRAVVPVRRGWYGLPVLETAESIARAVGGRLCLESAALHHGWAVKTVPPLPHVVLARGRRVSSEFDRRAVWHRVPSLRTTVTTSRPAGS